MTYDKLLEENENFTKKDTEELSKDNISKIPKDIISMTLPFMVLLLSSRFILKFIKNLIDANNY